MTLLERSPTEDVRGAACSPVLETERLVLRAPRPGDAKAVAALTNDRRIAENTARIPHPYRSPTRRTSSRTPKRRARPRS